MTSAEAYAEMDARARVEHEPGDRVIVVPPYRGGGQFVPDGHEGEWTVKERCAPVGGRVDYLLTRENAAVFMPATRISKKVQP